LAQKPNDTIFKLLSAEWLVRKQTPYLQYFMNSSYHSPFSRHERKMEACTYNPLDIWELEDSIFHLPDLLLADIVAGEAEAARLALLEPAGTPVVPEPRTDGEVRQCTCYSCIILSTWEFHNKIGKGILSWPLPMPML
jgi:hypothetical protein